MSVTRTLRRLSIAISLLATACVERGIQEWTTPYDYARPPVTDGVPSAMNAHPDGAIWNGRTSSGSFLFFDEKARGAGDLVTVVIDESMQAQGSALTDLERATSIGASASSDLGIAELATLPFSKLAEFFGIDAVAVAPGANINALESAHDNTFEGEGSTERSGRFTGIITCRVVKVLPGRIFHIRGRRSLVINHEEQFLTLEGLVRQEDIGINNNVMSSAIAEARMTLDGIGVIDDKQRPGLIARVMDWVYPF